MLLVMIQWMNYYYLDPWSVSMSWLIEFHEYVMNFMFFIMAFITIILLKILLNKNLNLFALDNEKLELFWTTVPCFILILLAVPSLNVLYSIEELNWPDITVKIIGHQWYWSYEISDFSFSDSEHASKTFDSYMIKSEIYRLLSVDKCVWLPFNTEIRGLVSSEDVLHSWAIPSLGIKMDACPGRINMIGIFSYREGKVYGQCSEICGVNHSFMPIVVKFVTPWAFSNWMFKNLPLS